MTRINVGILPKELSGPHLLAEHREIKRVPNCIKKGRYNIVGIPPQFTLGTGHVKWSYNKLKYLHDRYESIYKECCLRGYNVTYYGKCFWDLPDDLYKDYTPIKKDRDILIERLKERDQEFYKNII